MIKLFEVTGFKNFKETICLDFSDVRDYRFNDACILGGLLGKIIIYGKNSVGKSNFGLALFDITTHLTGNNVGPGLYDYYLNNNKSNKCAEFRYIFIFGKTEIEYSYRKGEKQQLLYEKLLIDKRLVFDYDNVKKSGNYPGIEEISSTINMTNLNVDSTLRYIIANTSLPELHPLRLFMEFVTNMLWFRSLDENRYIGYKAKTSDYSDFIFKRGLLNEFEGFLHKSGVKEKLIARKDPDGINRLYIDGPSLLPFFRVASSGTKALYTFFYWMKTASKMSLLFIDEFDAYYHYELSETLVKMLEEMSGTQVILTSHNTNLLSNRIMRPDCYFIMTEDGLTSFASATARELREGHNLEKLYISGEFDG